MANLTDKERYAFIEKMAPLIQKYGPQYDIFVCSAILAQACLESAFGTSPKAKYHNYFGMKYRANRVTCNSGFFEDGGSEQNPDGTYTLLPSSTAWYAFDSMEKGVEGYFQFINIANYKALKGETDPLKYLEKIKAAGYATSQKYVSNCYNLYVLKYNLTKYDNYKEDNKMAIKVAIDAGHGSNTAGKRHPDGFREHYSNVYMAYYLDQILTKNGFETLKVSWDDADAKDDSDIALATRQAQVKAFGAKLCVSIHANAHGNGSEYTTAKGVETLYHSNTAYVGDSVKLAQCIQNQLIKNTAQTNRGIKPQNLAMCNCKAMGVDAAVLVESAFMTNKAESELLKSDLFWRECAREIAQGIFDYLGVKGNIAVSLTSLPGTVPDSGSSNSAGSNSQTSAATGTPSTKLKAGDSFNLVSVPFFVSSTAKTSNSKKSGTFWVWSNEVINGRIRLTNAKSRVGISGMVSGWVEESVLVALLEPKPATTGKFVHGGLDYSIIFNPNYYANTYTDVKKVYGTNATKLFDHFIKYGMKEGRKPCAHFDVNVYKNRYPDLKKAFGSNLPEYYKHYIKHGFKEGRKPY